MRSGGVEVLVSESLRLKRIDLFGMRVHAVRSEEALEVIHDWVERADGITRYVVTPNVQHAVMNQGHSDFRAAYDAASLVLVDGAPLVWASRLLGPGLPERIAGSDFFPLLLASARPERPLPVYLLGAAPGIGERAARMMTEQFPNVRVLGTYSPPLGFENDEAENERIFELVNRAAPGVLVLGLGTPKQELWIHRYADRLRVPVVLCLGATIDFMAGIKVRAPVWMRRVGLEWIHRVAREPRRLAPRYASDAVHFPSLLWRELRGRQR